MTTMSECKTCWGTGYYHGHGGPCSEGCKPADATQGLREKWAEEATPPTGAPELDPTVGWMYEVLMSDPARDYSPELQGLIERACAGEKVRIVWPPGTYGMRTKMTGTNVGEIELHSNARGWPNYRGIPLTAELHLESYTTSDPTFHGVTLTRVAVTTVPAGSQWKEVNPGDIGEGRRGVKYEGLIVEVLTVDYDPSGVAWTIHLRFLSDRGSEIRRESMSGDYFDRQFEPNPTWCQKPIQSGGIVPNKSTSSPLARHSPTSSPLEVINWSLMKTLVDELKSPSHFLRCLLKEADFAQEYPSIPIEVLVEEPSERAHEEAPL